MVDLKLPQPQLLFVAGERPPATDVLYLLPTFSDESSGRIATHLGRPELEEEIELYRRSGHFTAKSGEIVTLLHAGVVLAGLGRSDSWHPDRMRRFGRTLGGMFNRYKGYHWNLLLPDSFCDAIQSYNSRYEQVASARQSWSAMVASTAEHYSTSPKATKKSRSVGKGGAGESSEEYQEVDQLDHLGPATLFDQASELVTAIVTGSEKLELCKGIGAAEQASSKKVAKSSASETISIHLICTHTGQKELEEAIERGFQVGSYLNGVRYLAHLPGNYLTPESFADYARDLARQSGCKFKVVQAAQLEKMGLNGIVSVGKGSEIAPRMVLLEYNGTKSGGRVALVGKGITFDTGGISIKPSAEMHEMKYDMAGAALVLHSITLAAKRKLPLRIVALIGLAENMPDGRAIKPGDVYTAYNGVTVEVQNTDAEGRLVLADLLSYGSEEYQPAMMLDFATLTGACVVALGHETAAMMTPHEEVARRVDAASRRTMDRAWRLPHWQEYGAGLKSDVADLRNIASRDGGSISAMRFLARFVDPQIPWAHFDIAGSAWRSRPGNGEPKGPTGWGIRLLNQLLEDLSAES